VRSNGVLSGSGAITQRGGSEFRDGMARLPDAAAGLRRSHASGDDALSASVSVSHARAHAVVPKAAEPR